MSSDISDAPNQLDPGDFFDELVERLRDDDPSIRDTARRTLADIGRRQARRLKPHPVVAAGKSVIFGFLTIVQILVGLAILLILILRVLLGLGAH